MKTNKNYNDVDADILNADTMDDNQPQLTIQSDDNQKTDTQLKAQIEQKQTDEIMHTNLNIDDSQSATFTDSDDDSNNARVGTLREFLAPVSLDRGATDYMIVGNKYVRTFYVEGFPEYVTIGYLESLYNKDYDVDISFSVKPRKQDEARKELQDKLTILKAQLEDEVQSGKNRERDIYSNKIRNLQEQISELTSKTEMAFDITLYFALYADSYNELERNTKFLLQSLRTDDITAYPFCLRQYEAWKSVVPYGIDYITDMDRNFNTGAIISSVPFYLPELYDELGVYLGTNSFTGTPALIDLYKKGIQNSNLNIFGASGSGKSTLVKVLTMRSSLHGIRTVIIDPEGEYEALTRNLHGAYIRLTSDVDNSQMMNIFDIEETETVDQDGNEIKTLELRPKIEDILGFCEVAYPQMTPGQAAALLSVIGELYARFGFVEGDPSSLYYNDDVIIKDGKLINASYKKPVPQLADLLDLISELVKDGTYPELSVVADALEPYRHSNTRGQFDVQTPESLRNLKDAPVITFDVSDLESNDVRTLAMYVLLSWTWEKFGKKRPEIKKRILVDEAWMMMAESMKGHEYTSQFLENMSRRIRKRNGSLTIATQRIEDFASNVSGKSILTNAHTTFLLSHETQEKNVVQSAFDLPDGVVDVIIEAARGRTLIKQGSQLYLVDVQVFDNEKAMATGNAASDS